jgi:hypothetical protein
MRDSSSVRPMSEEAPVAVREPSPPGESEAARAAARRRVNLSAWNLLLLVPLVGVLIPPFFNRTDPTLGGMPFFYWYQMLWIFVSVAVTVIVYRATRGER